MTTDDDREQLLNSARTMTDDELRIGAWAAAQRRDELVADEQHEVAGLLAELADVMCEARDERARLLRAAEDAACPVSASPARLLRTASTRRNQRRRRG